MSQRGDHEDAWLVITNCSLERNCVRMVLDVGLPQSTLDEARVSSVAATSYIACNSSV